MPSSATQRRLVTSRCACGGEGGGGRGPWPQRYCQNGFILLHDEDLNKYPMLLTLSQVKLAEKDAQLMGGFGEMSRLRDLDDDLGIPMVTMPRSRDVSVIDALVMGGSMGLAWGDKDD